MLTGRRRGAGDPAGRPPATAVLLAAALAVACASAGGSGSGPAPEERPRAERPVDEGAGTARRAASRRLVERGEELLAAGRTAEAAALLERAVRVDPSNGFAFLALGRARVAAGEADRALGLLERASTLLRAHPQAAAEADSLREALRSGGGR